MAKQLPRQIDGLKQKILFVGTLVEEAITKAISALNENRQGSLLDFIEEKNLVKRVEVYIGYDPAVAEDLQRRANADGTHLPGR
jgi:hypothetical protein